jgi:hypothetical protein
MKSLLTLALTLVTLSLLAVTSCGPGGDEAMGDKAYDMAQRAKGGARREQHKTAYVHYRRAILADPDKASTRLRNRFIDMSLVRAHMILEEGGATMGAIPLLQEDIERFLNDEVDRDLRQRYSAFLVQMGDSSAAKERFIDALTFYDHAISLAADPSPFKTKRATIVGGVANENYEVGRSFLESGRPQRGREGDVNDVIRAEYYAKVALHFDSTHERARRLLSEAYQANLANYAAFLTVIEDYTDTVMFRKINKFDILLAIPDLRRTGNTARAIIHMHSATFNPLRMRSEHFSLVDANGNVHTAARGQRMDPDILAFEREAQYTLNFTIPANARIRKLVYENGPHRTEKYFF